MPETSPLLERVMERVELRPFTLEGFHDRRDHKRRNQRIRAGVLGIAIAIAVGWLGVNAIRSAPPVPADPTPTPELRRDGEVLVFEPRATGKGWDLAAQDPQTGEVRTIVETDEIIDCPDAEGCRSFVREAEWSADGRWLAFEVTHANLDGPAIGPCAPTVGVWVTNALGELGQLTTPCDAPAPDAVEEVWEWSPVGARLAYARVDGETDELFVINPSDGGRMSLGTADIEPRNGASPGWALEWSPDGTRIAYADGDSVYAVDVDAGEPSLLADSFEWIIEIAWSPDGTHILVHDQGRYRLQVMNADGSDLHVLLEGEDACCETEWSPDGDRVLYQLSIAQPGDNPDGLWHSETWTVSPDGSNPIEIFDSNDCGTFDAMDDTLPVWAPDGTQVAYNDCGVWVVANADGTGEARPLGGLAPADLVVPLLHRSWNGGGLSQWDLALIGQVDH
jgi:hypothetical protein